MHYTKNYKYEYIFFKDLYSRLNLKKLDSVLTNEGIKPVDEENMDQRISKYFAFLNEGTSRNFSEEELEKFHEYFSRELYELEQEPLYSEVRDYVLRTYEKFFFSEIKDNYIYYGPVSFEFMAPSDAITLGINYIKFDIKANSDREYERELERQDGVIVDMMNHIQTNLAKETGIKLAAVAYNEVTGKDEGGMMGNSRPILKLIEESTVNGRLPEDFTLPVEDLGGGLKMAPGAMDGLVMYHQYPGALGDEGREMVARAVQAAAAGDKDAFELFEALGGKYRAISIADGFNTYILQHANELDQAELLAFAVNKLLFEGRTPETVKFGLLITELYGEFDERFDWIFRALGLYDEFTAFSVFNMRHWDRGNEEIFALAKKVNGWGKIHAVEHLQPLTDEIRDWILYEGMDNGVTNEYLALTCMEKSGAAERLKGRLSSREFSAISHILFHLFEEGPVLGISALQDAEETLEDYLTQAENMNPGIEDYEVMLKIGGYAAGKGESSRLEEHARRILRSDACRDCVLKAVQEGRGIDLAKAMKIPYKNQLLKLMRTDFRENYFWCIELMKDPGYADDVLRIFRAKLPPERLKQGPRDVHDFGEEFEADRQINLMLQELDAYPGKGEEYLLRAISAQTIRSRGMSVRVMKAWVSAARKPLKRCYPKLYRRLAEVYPMEVHEGIKADMKKLLDGETNFQKN